MRIATPRVFAFLATTLLFGGSSTFGQRPEGGRGGFDPRVWYSRMDTNKNGIIEPTELDDRSRSFLSRMPGIDISKPVPIDKLIEAGNQMRQNWGNGEGRSRGWGFGGGSRGGPSGRDGGRDGGSREGRDGGRDGGSQEGRDGGRDGGSQEGRGDERGPSENRGSNENNGDSNNNANSSTPARNAFGDPNAKARPASGFGNSTDTASGNNNRSDRTERRSERGESDQRKFREYAQSLMNQHDKDKDGVLRKSSGEWDELKSDHQTADTDSNGQITVDELTTYFGKLASKSDSGSASGSRSRSTSSGSKPAQLIKSYRGKTATERLPSGLPDWFLRNDADGDGQIMMSEYAASWTDEKVNEFNSFDVDGDGFITAKECLKKSDRESSRRK